MNAQPAYLRAADIHARIDWPSVLAQLGIAEAFLRPKKQGPCPVPGCGGENRYHFDNRHGRGDYFCRQCGPGDGFSLLMKVYGWDFKEAKRRVTEAAGLAGESLRHTPHEHPRRAPRPSPTQVAMPSRRVLSIARSACAVADCPDAVSYLESRGLWPLPAGCMIKAHAALDYWQERQQIGRYAGLVGEVRDVSGELVTVHCTYLASGRKLEGYEPRKMLTKVDGREGCAVRLMPPGETLGIAEGIETALSAAVLDGVPVWAALNTALLSKFEPPPGVMALRIYSDRDTPGLLAAGQLMERLQGRVPFELRSPPAPAKDWNDLLTSRRRGEGSSND